MNEQCMKILALFKDTVVDFRRLLMMIDRFYWEEFSNNRNEINSCINQLVEKELIFVDTVTESDGRQWKGYRITEKGKEYLTKGN